MKKLTLLSVLFCSSLFLHAQVVPVTAQLVDGSGAASLTSFLRFQLFNCGSNLPTLASSSLVVIKQQFDLKPDPVTGIITGDVVPNDKILCGGVASTLWTVTPMKDALTPMQPSQQYDILSNAGTFNLATAMPSNTALAAPGFVIIFGNPTQSQTLNQPVGTKLTFLGTYDFTQATVLGLATSGGSGGGPFGTVPCIAYYTGSGNSCDTHATLDGLGNGIFNSLTVNGVGLQSVLTLGDNTSLTAPPTGTLLIGSLNGRPQALFGNLNYGMIETSDQEGIANGIAGLDGSALLPLSQLVSNPASCNGSTLIKGDRTCGSSGSSPSVVSVTTSTTLGASSDGALVLATCSSACTITLWASPTNGYKTTILSIGSSTPTIALNGLQYNGASLVPVILPDVALPINSNGTAYFGSVPFTAGAGVSLTSSTNGLQISASGGGSGATIMPFTTGGSNVSNSAVSFVGPANVNSAEPQTQWPVARAGTVSNLQCRINQTMSGSMQYTVVVMHGLASTNSAITTSATAITCTLNSTNSRGCNDTTHSFTVAAGDVLDLQSTPANTPTATNLICSLQLL